MGGDMKFDEWLKRRTALMNRMIRKMKLSVPLASEASEPKEKIDAIDTFLNDLTACEELEPTDKINLLMEGDLSFIKILMKEQRYKMQLKQCMSMLLQLLMHLDDDNRVQKYFRFATLIENLIILDREDNVIRLIQSTTIKGVTFAGFMLQKLPRDYDMHYFLLMNGFLSEIDYANFNTKRMQEGLFAYIQTKITSQEEMIDALLDIITPETSLGKLFWKQLDFSPAPSITTGILKKAKLILQELRAASKLTTSTSSSSSTMLVAFNNASRSDEKTKQENTAATSSTSTVIEPALPAVAELAPESNPALVNDNVVTDNTRQVLR